MMFTDPPYGVAIGDKNKTLDEVQKSGRITTNIKNDNIAQDELYRILVATMKNAKEFSKEDAVYYVTSPQGGELGLMMMMMMKDAGLPVRHVLMWEKNSATFSLGRLDYDYQHEPMFYTWAEKHHNYREGENRTTVWKYDKPRKCDLHPTMKPVALVANAIKDGTKKGDVVLDLFGGSGTTLIACEQLGRKCRMMELDPYYCQVIIDRWEALTGEKAEKIAGYLTDHRCLDVEIIDLTPECSWTDAFVIGTVTSTGHLKGVVHQIWDLFNELGMKVENRHKNPGTDGWELIDLGDVVVHLMSSEMREFYNLEKLWKKVETM